MKSRILAILFVAGAGVAGLVLTREPATAAVNNAGFNAITSAAFVGGHLVFTRADGAKIDAGALPITSGFVIPTGTPTAATPGVDGQMMQDSRYLYTFLSGSWSKSPRMNLAPL